MDFLENAVAKAKEVFDVAYAKTETCVNTQKQKFDLASEENKLTKEFAKLGKLIYTTMGEELPREGEAAEILAAIAEKEAKIAELKAEINNAKNRRLCPQCGAAISNDAQFCSFCGAKLQFGSEENE